ncbi:glycoside hydrolase family 65 protein [Pontibacter flavimaris]|uniref:Trehalose 6-phosphate phosphorylase n=1 Tax=Pontibacter flavimaris TaxID=1797110 RepID=A0A1Q5PGK2_9BACT|nr:glycosyl hydrolase family 65 protein [Pontibacter flavimaris]OKL41368.1 trehalose 6-phosphate phosphorylase [Pontibacter flavimaris]
MQEWDMTYDSWEPEQQLLREALCTLGNGYFATRGAFEEASAERGIHYPGTYLAGGYNRLTSEIAGKNIENEDLVNWPNWLPLTFRHPGGEWFDIRKVELIAFRQELDMRQGLLQRRLHFRDKQDRETLLVSRRFVSMANKHVTALQWELTPLNWSGAVEVAAALDGRVTNSGVERYSALQSQHLAPVQQGRHNGETIFLEVQTVQSRLVMAQAARLRAYRDSKPVDLQLEVRLEEGYAAQQFTLQLEQNKPVVMEKIVQVHTSRDQAITEPLQEACKNIERQGTFGHLLERHALAWQRLWNRCDFETSCNEKTQGILRLHIFHLLQTVSANTVGFDVGVPARGLHGEAYRGHIFWDELFIFPFLNLRLPELTRELLLYRFRRLPEARYAATQAGYRGAMFPWQSGSNGREESQVIHLNPQSGRWLPDNTFLQRHISAAVAYNVWQYYQATDDMGFMTFVGGELIFDIAQFWSSIATFNPERGRYEIRNVVGPDEYHTEYPDSDEPGLNNNAYTNVMAVWVIQVALKLFDILDDARVKELCQKLSITAEDQARWRDIAAKMYIPFIDDSGIIAQFEGYERLAEFPWEAYREKYGEAMRLDRILESEGDNVNKYKASKQADVLMLFYLFSSKELLDIFERLQYDFSPACILENIAYYEQRTSHGSTLSKIVHAWVLARSDRRKAWHSFQVALVSDVEDIQGGTTAEGIHLGAMAGTVDLVQRGFMGLEIRDEVLWLDPVLPEELGCLNFHVRYRSHWISIRLTQHTMRVSFDRSWSKEVRIGVQGQVYTFKTGEQREFTLMN